MFFDYYFSRYSFFISEDRQLTGTLRFALADLPEPTDQTPEQALEALCAVSKDDIRPETPILFANLVDILQKETDCTVMDTLFHRLVAQSDGLCPSLTLTQRHQILHDTIPAVGTLCSVKLFTKLLQEGIVEYSDAELWFAALAFLRDPTKETIETLLVKMKKKTNFLSSTFTRLIFRKFVFQLHLEVKSCKFSSGKIF